MHILCHKHESLYFFTGIFFEVGFLRLLFCVYAQVCSSRAGTPLDICWESLLALDRVLGIWRFCPLWAYANRNRQLIRPVWWRPLWKLLNVLPDWSLRRIHLLTSCPEASELCLGYALRPYPTLYATSSRLWTPIMHPRNQALQWLWCPIWRPYINYTPKWFKCLDFLFLCADWRLLGVAFFHASSTALTRFDV